MQISLNKKSGLHGPVGGMLPSYLPQHERYYADAMRTGLLQSMFPTNPPLIKL